jgi:hypothetical protein
MRWVLFVIALADAHMEILFVHGFLQTHRIMTQQPPSTRRTSIAPILLLLRSNNNRRQNAQRWNGNYKHVSKKLADVKKSKKLSLQLTANGVTKTLHKKREESLQHVLTKAMIWKLFMNDYPEADMEIEKDIGDPEYLPDVIAFERGKNHHDDTRPLLWGESGRMKPHKAVDLMRRYPCAHIVHCRWGMEIETFAEPLLEFMALEMKQGRMEDPKMWWNGKLEFVSLPLDVWRFVDEASGDILITKEDVEWETLDPVTLSGDVANRMSHRT